MQAAVGGVEVVAAPQAREGRPQGGWGKGEGIHWVCDRLGGDIHWCGDKQILNISSSTLDKAPIKSYQIKPERLHPNSS